MKALKIVNTISIYILYLAAAVFVVGGTLTVAFRTGHMTNVLLGSLFIALTSIPFALANLIQAYRRGVISLNYIVFSVLISCFVAGLGWFVIPFSLRRDIAEMIQAREAADASATEMTG